MAERITPYLHLVTAPNPGPMTLDGTNTWVVGDPDLSPPLVVDPGPQHLEHLDAVLRACGGRAAGILLTHHHLDHAEGAAWLGDRLGCTVRGGDAGPLVDAERTEVAGATLEAYATPGHTADSFSFLLRGHDGAARLLTGDTVLGRGTTVIMAAADAEREGDLAAYFGSLALLELLVNTQRVVELLPGHGPRVSDPGGWLHGYRQHRVGRLAQVRAAVAAGASTAAEVVAVVYADVDPAVWPAAEMSVLAQLRFLDS